MYGKFHDPDKDTAKKCYGSCEMWRAMVPRVRDSSGILPASGRYSG